MQKLFGTEFIFTSRSNVREISLSAGAGEILSLNNVQINGHLQFIEKLSDLPAPVAGVITLEDLKVYTFVHAVDLLGSRLLCGQETVITGTSPGTSSLTSTGLGVGVPLITSTYTLILREITIHDVNTLFSISQSSTYITDLNRVVLSNISYLGVISNSSSFSCFECSFTYCAGLEFKNSIGAILMLFSNFLNVAITPMIIIDSTCVISRSFQNVGNNYFPFGATSLIDIEVGAVIPNQGFKLFDCSSSNNSLISGASVADNSTFWSRNLGIPNSRSVGNFHINSPAATTVVVNTWTKLLGSTIASTFNSKFSHSNNRLTYNGNITQVFDIFFSVSLTGTNSNVIQIGISVNGGTPLDDSIVGITLDSGGKASNVAMAFFGQLVAADYVEIYVKNTSGSQSVTASSMSLTITE